MCFEMGHSAGCLCDGEGAVMPVKWYILRDSTKITPKEFHSAEYHAKIRSGDVCGEIEKLEY
jgi:hypothetical protein